MSFNVERMKKVRFMAAQLNDAVTIHFVLKLQADVMKKIVPPPLVHDSSCQAHFVMNLFRRTSLPGVDSYLETAILLEVGFGNVKGNLTLAMLLNDDNAMIGGREFFGFPKKLAEIEFNIDSKISSGKASRRSIDIVKFECEIADEIENPAEHPGPFGDACFNIKCFPDPGLRKFDYPPRLIKHRFDEKLKQLYSLKNMKLNIEPSQFDPWNEIEPFEIIRGYRREYDSTILPGEVVAELEGDSYFRYALNRFI